MNSENLNGVVTYVPYSSQELINYAFKYKKILVALNAEKILNINNQIKSIVNQNIGYPDGIGVVWALKKKGYSNAIKIPGCELWLEIIEEFYKKKSIYLVGGSNEVINSTVRKLKKEYLGIKICNFRNGFFDSENDEKILIEDIKKNKPDIIFVAMGSPKQELLMDRIQKNYKAVYLGLGGSFDVYTGNVKRAPKWLIKNNLEWAYRLINQPIRIKRQIYLLWFFILLKFNKL